MTYGCATCCGYNATQLWFDPIALLFDGPPADDGVWGYNVCEQGYDDVSSSFYGNWSSVDTSVITVDQYGTHTPQNLGSTTTSTFGDIESTAHYPICPVKEFNSSGGGNVQVYAQISSVMVNPTSISESGSAVVTVQIYHQNTSQVTNPSVDVEVSTYSSNPSGIVLHYDPSTPSTVPLSGTSPATATFTVSYSSGGIGSVVIQATLSNPSPSTVTIMAPNPASNAQATLGVTQ